MVAGCASPGFQQSETVSLEVRRVSDAATAFETSANTASSTLDALHAEPMLDMAKARLARAGIAANADLTNNVRENAAQFADYSHGWSKALDDAITATSITPSVSK